MADLSRRLFLGGALALTGAAIASAAQAAPSVPRLRGDGIHDDTFALQTLFNGQPVIVESSEVRASRGGRITLNGGRFLVSDTLTLAMPASIDDVEFIALDIPHGKPLIHVPANRDIVIGTMAVNMRT